jgi:hypothetical protein
MYIVSWGSEFFTDGGAWNHWSYWSFRKQYAFLFPTEEAALARLKELGSPLVNNPAIKIEYIHPLNCRR